MSPAITYAYYPGCSGQGTSMEYESSTRALLEALGVNIVEIPDWSCCGATPAHTVDHSLSSALVGRNLAIAEDMDVQGVITPCPSCLTNLKSATHKMQDETFREKVNKLLDKPAQASLPVKSVLQVIYEDIGPERIAEKVVKPLKGLKVAPYYGCITTRPPELMQFDDPENPISMDRLLEAAGAEVMDFPLKVECCGASHGPARKDVVARLSGKLLDIAQDTGAAAVVAACPLCQMNLDLRQGQVNSLTGGKHHMPIFYYTQLLGLALGLPEEKIGLDKLAVNPAGVLARAAKAAEEAAAGA
jgi:heterodisulfide reductase subunit B